MKTFELGKKYKNIIWNGFYYEQKGTVELVSRVPKMRISPRGTQFPAWPAIINGIKTWVDLGVDKDHDVETLHEVSYRTGEWKRKTIRYSAEEV